GAAALLLLAEESAAEAPPPRSLLLVWSTAGEQGHFGAQWAASHLPAPADSIAAALEFEMVGRGASDTLYDVGTGQISAALSHLADSIGSAATPPVRWFHSPAPIPAPSRPLYCQSDLGAFVRLGIPGLELNGGPYPEYRRPDDAAGTVDGAKIARVAAFATELSRAVAALPRRPTVDSAGSCR
ncbi:MAG: M28 family metallopeptidase, partial [Gemmatimonadales bacterium]